MTMTFTKEIKSIKEPVTIPDREIFIMIEGQAFYGSEVEALSDQNLKKLQAWLLAEEIVLASAKGEWNENTPGYDVKKKISFGVKLNAVRQFYSLVVEEINTRRALNTNNKGSDDFDDKTNEFLKLVEVRLGREAVEEMWEIASSRAS